MRFRVVRVYLVLLLEVLAHLAETGSFVEKVEPALLCLYLTYGNFLLFGLVFYLRARCNFRVVFLH